MKPFEVGVISVVPSPYQRDIFRAMAASPEISLKVYYLEAAAPDSPWPEEPLQPYEMILHGRYVSVAGNRFHVVTEHPNLRECRAVILNNLTSSLAQYLLRSNIQDRKLLFWGEALRDQESNARRLIQHLVAGRLRNVSAIVAIGTEAEKSYRLRFPSVPIYNIPYHCNLQPFMDSRASFDRSRSAVRFLFCGQMIARKGVDILVRAFDLLIRKGLDAELILTGREADLEKILQQIPDSTKQKISYEGFSDPKDLPQIFSRADVFVLPSRYDGWGVVVNQAIGAGLPVICSDAVGAGYDLVESGRNGFRVPAGEIDRLASAMESFITQPNLLAEFGQRSSEIARHWTPEKGAQRWVTVLSTLFNNI
jgi:poly(glycerol-phosphate) alpha-glucosyltransferase